MRDVIRKSEFAFLKQKNTMKNKRKLEEIVHKIKQRLVKDTKKWTPTETHLILDFIESIDPYSARKMLVEIMLHNEVNRMNFDSTVTPRAWSVGVKISEATEFKW